MRLRRSVLLCANFAFLLMMILGRCLFLSPALAQEQPAVVSSGSVSQSVTAAPSASALAAESIAALTNGVSIADVTLSGVVTTTAGSDIETGTGTFSATAAGQSRLDLTLGSGTDSEIRNVANGTPFGEWIKNGVATPFAGQNCLTDAAWFFPALTSLAASDPSITISYIGLEQRAGASVYHLQLFRDMSSFASRWGLGNGTTLPSVLSTTQFYLDSGTLLPAALTFYAHPDKDWSTNIPVEIDFSNYQTMNGIAVPSHIQKYLQNGLILDLVVSNVAVNSGIPSSTFNLQGQ